MTGLNPISQSAAGKLSGTATLRDVAALAGVSLAAASLALRSSGKISAATRERVGRAAQELGYVPNPLAAAFQSQIRQGRGRKYQATLAWINDYPEPDFWAGKPLFESARARCAQLGYVLDEVHIDPSAHMDEPAVLAGQFQRILRARGIHGAILPGLYRPGLAAEKWDGFAVVLLGHFEGFLRMTKVARVREVIYHNVRSSVLLNTRIAVDRLERLGCKRIGFVQTVWGDEALGGEATAGFLEARRKWPLKQRLMPLFLKTNRDREPFLQWLKRHRPDAILCVNDEILEWTRQAGLKVPEDVRLAHLHTQSAAPGWSGIDERSDRIAEAGVDLLTAHLIRNETGIPPYPKTVGIPGEWHQNRTA